MDNKKIILIRSPIKSKKVTLEKPKKKRKNRKKETKATKDEKERNERKNETIHKTK